MKLILDVREHSLIEYCQKYLSQNPKINIELETKQLELGDAILHSDKDILCIERKTIQDLLASIKDGRYEEQSHRLANASGVPTHNVIYIIEGFLSSVIPSEQKLVYSTITSLNFFKGFSVLRTSNINETAEVLLLMSDKIGRDLEKGRLLFYKWNDKINESSQDMPTENIEFVEKPCSENPCSENPSSENTTTSYANFVKKVKKENLTPQNMSEIILCQIPGISAKTAAAIMAKSENKSLRHLLKTLEENPAYLHDILLENGRKISKTCAKNIFEFLL